MGPGWGPGGPWAADWALLSAAGRGALEAAGHPPSFWCLEKVGFPSRVLLPTHPPLRGWLPHAQRHRAGEVTLCPGTWSSDVSRPLPTEGTHAPATDASSTLRSLRRSFCLENSERAGPAPPRGTFSVGHRHPVTTHPGTSTGWFRPRRGFPQTTLFHPHNSLRDRGPHFTDEDSEAERLSDLPEAAQPSASWDSNPGLMLTPWPHKTQGCGSLTPDFRVGLWDAARVLS